jgi:hypothetical protein
MSFSSDLQELRRSLEADQQAQAQALVQAQMLAQAQVQAQAHADAKAQAQAKGQEQAQARESEGVAESASAPPAQPTATQPEMDATTTNRASQIDGDAILSEANFTPPQTELGGSAYIDPTSSEILDASASAIDATAPIDTSTTEKDSALPSSES